VVAAAYVLAARAGFLAAFSAEQITTVWAPTGIAQAALLLWGRALWPAVWVGAFSANLFSDAPAWTAAAIATGNTLEAVALASLLPRARFDPGLTRVSDAVRLIVLGAIATPVIAATIGVASLCLAGEQAWIHFARLWSEWWLGDALGSIVVAPAILAVARSAQQQRSAQWLAAAVMSAATAAVTALVFGDALGDTFGRGPLHYVLFPLVIVAAVRYGQPCAALVVVTASVLTIVNTVRGVGPFSSADVRESLILLQTFMGVLAGTGLLLAAAMTERKIIQRRVSAAHAVGEVLADAADLDAAAPAILRGICESLQWQFGGIWLVDAGAGVLRPLRTWVAAPSPSLQRFEGATGQLTFARGIGLPGRVWASGRAAWIEDVAVDRNFPRAPVAADAGLHGAFAFPIRIGGEVAGVIEFFTFQVVAPDTDLLEAMSTIGAQVGQFIDRKRVEMSIRQSEARFRTLAASSSALTLYEQDLELRYTWLYPYHPEFFTHTIGRTDFDLMPNAEGERLMAIKRRVVESGSGTREEVSASLPEGQRSYDLMVEPRRDAAGAIVGVAGVSVDITERKRQEQLLRDSQQQLRDADRRKDEFLAMLAHELRNPMAPIRTGLEFLRVSRHDAASVERVLPMMERQVSHMVRLIDDLLDVSRITSGKIHLQKERAYLAEMVHAAVDANRIAIEGGGARLVTELPDAPVQLLVDPTRFVQVLSNLLHNAAKFTGNGGTITVSARVIDGGSHGTLLLTVADTGAGIAADLLPHVFELFTQGRAPDGQNPSGLGIGLALARRLLEMHGGSIAARSDGPGTGSEFTIRLPLAGAQPPRSSDGAATAPSPRLPAERRVLVVDDNADAADMLAWLVRSIGGEARTVYDGAAAVREAADFEPDVVLLDIGMPGMDGYEACRLIRAQAGRQPFIVAISGFGQDRDKALAAEAGFDAHITKPADPVRLEQLLVNAAPGLRTR
jgi:signal transduction histidine kinase/integral membrane sensor domain MASE1/ActR/RegA family two-component response regulator